MKKILYVFAFVGAIGAAVVTTAFKPKTIYYYNDGSWKVFSGIPCDEGSVDNCQRFVAGVLRDIYKSQSLGDHLRFNP